MLIYYIILIARFVNLYYYDKYLHANYRKMVHKRIDYLFSLCFIQKKNINIKEMMA